MDHEKAFGLTPDDFQLLADAIDGEENPNCWSQEETMWSIHWLIGNGYWRTKRLGLGAMMEISLSTLNAIADLEDDNMRKLAVLGVRARKIREITGREPRDIWPDLANKPLQEVLEALQ
ncbi:hypothetical protein [Magnetospirillum moscoviense]|uniref:Uncharacterized protein n=1 Tax=Magnetospirillum moscoviense TaxID=1437059 RepID=A0A178MBX6_9PROT|nr:hypothetical protein [Magnetospirillum moscoviense]OAN46300.1 hypothetical protein A6A05_16220 [Magnetospirillum moscoviense]